MSIAISAGMVKELRERTGSGMMECKKALVEANGDMELAIENMRKSGLAKADKKSGRIAAEGIISVKVSDDGKSVAIVDINCETDFVAKADDFVGFVNSVTVALLNSEGIETEEQSNCYAINKTYEIIRFSNKIRLTVDINNRH